MKAGNKNTGDILNQRPGTTDKKKAGNWFTQ
jgi:hypothetical protein